jgi:hypothetical protein
MAGKQKWKFAEFEDPKLSTVAQALQMNRTLYVDQFSEDPDFENQMLEIGSTSELFEKIPAKANVDVETLDGDMANEDLLFSGIAEFKKEAITLKLEALREQSETADILEHFTKLFGKGSKWKQVFDDPATRAGFLERLNAVLDLVESA